MNTGVALYLMLALLIAGLSMDKTLESEVQASTSDSREWREAEVFPATREYQAPDFKAQSLDGEVIRLHDFHGQIVVLNFWATWCPPCRKEVPSLIRLQNSFPEDLQVIGISLDEPSALQQVVHFQKEFDVTYPIVLDDGDVNELYGPLSVIPTTYIIDKKGNIAWYIPGYLSYARFEETIQMMLK
ncbi:TlpA disulfide reductase family protein [Balneolaceae bacterium ANBcel3]|nr:TlpA disulfide reductase family protein [Balneolaceae bacterium ANBcel3]